MYKLVTIAIVSFLLSGCAAPLILAGSEVAEYFASSEDVSGAKMRTKADWSKRYNEDRDGPLYNNLTSGKSTRKWTCAPTSIGHEFCVPTTQANFSRHSNDLYHCEQHGGTFVKLAKGSTWFCSIKEA